MVYIVNIDTGRSSVKRTNAASYADAQAQVKALREAGQSAWWEFRPDHSAFVTGRALAQPRLCEVL